VQGTPCPYAVLTVWGWVRERVAPSRGVPYAVTVWGWVRERVAPSRELHVRTQSRSGDGSVRSHGLGMGPGASRTLSWVLTVWGWVRERVAPSRGVPVSPTVKFLETATTDVRRRPQDFFLGVGNEGV